MLKKSILDVSLKIPMPIIEKSSTQVFKQDFGESMGMQTCIHQNIVQHSKFEKTDLPTTELGTTWQTGIRYIMPFFRKIVHHRKQEYCTSMKTGILYNTEKRNFVQHRKQEYCTSLTDEECI